MRDGAIPRRAAPVALLVLALCGCEGREAQNRSAEMKVGEERALDDAASMLDESRLPADPLEEPLPQGGATPEPPGL